LLLCAACVAVIAGNVQQLQVDVDFGMAQSVVNICTHATLCRVAIWVTRALCSILVVPFELFTQAALHLGSGCLCMFLCWGALLDLQFVLEKFSYQPRLLDLSQAVTGWPTGGCSTQPRSSVSSMGYTIITHVLSILQLQYFHCPPMWHGT
jgi:hypothetical protein